MREESDNRSALLELRLQLGNEGQGLGVGVVEVEDDQRGLLFAVLLHALGQIFIVLGELHLDVEFARRLLNFGGEEQVVDEGKDARGGIFAQRGERLGIGRREGRSEAGTRTASRTLAVVAVAGQRGAIAVIHGRSVDAILIVARLAGAGGTGPAWIVRAASATPSASASATGGSSWSCVHSPLKAAGPDLRSGAGYTLSQFQVPHLVAAGSCSVGAQPLFLRGLSTCSVTPLGHTTQSHP